MQVFLQVFLGAGQHKTFREKGLQSSQPTGKPQFLSEVPSAMGVGFLDDMVSPSFELLSNGCVFISYGCKGRQAIDCFTKEFVKAIGRSSVQLDSSYALTQGLNLLYFD